VRRFIGRVPTITIFFVVAFGSSSLCAQDSATDDLKALQGADTSCPRATLKSFIDACDEAYHLVRGEGRSYRSEVERRAVKARALRCLDLSQVPTSVLDSVGGQSAVCLKEVLDRIDLPAEETWPDDAQVTESEITRWRIPGTEIIIAKVKQGLRFRRPAR
jgi:MscS family membrane protein